MSTETNPEMNDPKVRHLAAIGFSVLLAQHFGVDYDEESDLYERLRLIWERIEPSEDTKANMFEPRPEKLTDYLVLHNQGSGGSTITLRPPQPDGPIVTKNWRADIESGDPLSDGFYETSVRIDPESMERLRVRLNAMLAAANGAHS